MKKRFIISLFSFFVVTISYSQTFKVGTNLTNLGLAFGGDLDGLNDGSVGLSASHDRGLWNISGPGVISLGGYLGVTRGNDNSYRSKYYSEKWRYLIGGIRSAYHYSGFTKIPQLDVYGGAMLSYNFLSYSYSDINGIRHRGSSVYNSGVSASIYVGGRWFFRDTLAAFIEGGYGVSSIRIGATFKL